MSKINYKLTTIKNIEYKVPKICPICHMPQNPEILDTRTSADYLEVQVETILLAKCTNCNKYYLLPYKVIGRNEVTVTMHDTITNNRSIFQSWNHMNNTILFTPFKMCLESYDIIKRTHCIILS